MAGLEARLRTACPRLVWNAHKQGCPKVNLLRLADDCVITAATQELLEHEVKPVVEAFLRERGLDLSPEKTRITHLEEGCDFLGQHLWKSPGKLLIKPSGKSIKTVLRTVRGVSNTNKSAAAGTLICLLNPLLRGWALYHRHVVSARVCQSVDPALFQALGGWANRRHHTKGVRWVKARYFATRGTQHWGFSGAVRGPTGHRSAVHLFAAHRLPISRHTKSASGANPYDPGWEAYCEQRLDRTMRTSLTGHERVRSLWQRQEGRCPHCEDTITPDTGWHSHHKVWRSRGGSNTIDNLVLLHPTCHSQVHHSHGSPCMPHPVTRVFGKAGAGYRATDKSGSERRGRR